MFYSTGQRAPARASLLRGGEEGAPLKKKILVVEDDPVNGLVLMDFLDAHGYTTSLARNGADGVVAFGQDEPDLMIVDILLPLKNGFEVCFDVKRTPRGEKTPILLMSAIYKDLEHAKQYANQGL